MTSFCTYAQVPADKPPMRMAVAAPVVEAAIVVHKGEGKPALILQDGKAVVLTFGQMCLLAKLFRDWSSIIIPTEKPVATVTAMTVPEC